MTNRARPFHLFREAGRLEGLGVAEGEHDLSVAELFARVVDLRPEREALVCDGERLTYAALDARANRLARRLAEVGVRPGDRVGVSLERSAELVASMLAVLKAGASYVPLDSSYPAERLAFMRRDAGVRALVVARAADAELAADERVRVVALAEERAAIDALPDEAPGARAWPESEAYVVYTSGSTGAPKGIAIPQHAIARLARDPGYARLGPADRVAQMANTSFDAAAFEIWGALLNGATLVMIGRDVSLHPAALAAALRAEGVTAAFLTTALLNAVSRTVPDAFAGLGFLGFGGEAADPAAVRRILVAGAPERLIHFYGPAENTTFATWHAVESVAHGAVTVPIGGAVSGTTVHVLDAEMRPVPDGAAGELCLGGVRLAHGYVARPGMTAERFVPDAFSGVPGARLYRTGDQVRRNARGELEFVGRLDGQVKVRGFRIELEEVAAVLERHPAVTGAVAHVREDAPGDRRLVAYVVARAEEADDASLGTRVRGWLKSQLPHFMVPSAVVVMEAFPLTPNGKVDRRALPAPEWTREDTYVAPRTETEATLAAIFAEVLGIERVGVDDDFFHMGGHSLLATQVVSRVRQ
ncbi:MAG TPA: non-ribosomal peptide synthetase, partial [Longimicrobium sp.]|nr:non-ribosomal peptide synthetase [Longimicrobium sp.]